MNQELDVVAIRDVETPTIDAAAFDKLETMPEGFNATAEYLKFEKPGDMRRVFWTGWTTMPSKQIDAQTGKPKEIDAGVFLWRESPQNGPKRVIHAGSNLVLQLKSIGHHGHPVPLQITFKGKQKANTGNSFDAFDVVVLNGNAPRAERNDEQFSTSAPKAELLPVSTENRAAVSGLQADIDENYFEGETGKSRLPGAIVVVKEQLAARNISLDFVKSKSPKPDAWSVFKTAVSIMANYDQHAPTAA